MKKDKLALCFILKDEGETIEEVIQSFHDKGNPIYNRLVVGIDDSTTDNTYEIVKKYTDEISFFTWEENFSKHRNDIIEKIDKDWIIVFPDGHEVLRPKGLETLKAFLVNSPQHVNVFSPFIEIDVDEFDIPEVIFRRPLLFRNTGKVKFHRGVHNFLFDSKNKLICSLPEMSYIHNMPSKRKEMRSDMRKDMNVRKLTESVAIKPKDARDNYYLGDAYDESGNFEMALKYFKKAFKLSDQKDPDMAAQVCISIVNMFNNNGRYKDGIVWAHKGLQNKYNRAELYYFLGVCNYKLERYEEAIHWYTFCTQVTIPTDSSYFLLAKMYSWLPWDGIMASKYNLGDYEGALEAALKIKKWKKNKKTGEYCPSLLNNIKALEDIIEYEKKEEKARQILSGSAIVDIVAQDILGNMKTE